MTVRLFLSFSFIAKQEMDADGSGALDRDDIELLIQQKKDEAQRLIDEAKAAAAKAAENAERKKARLAEEAEFAKRRAQKK